MSKNGKVQKKLDESLNKYRRNPIATKSYQLPDGRWVRKGTRIPFKKPSVNEREDRIQALAEFIMKHPFATRSKMAKQFCRKWECSWKTVEWNYVEPARKRVTILAGMTQAEAREKALGVVMSLMDHPNSRTRLRAVVAFARITGIEAPNRTELTGPNGGPIQAMSVRPLVDLSADELRKLATKALEIEGNGASRG